MLALLSNCALTYWLAFNGVSRVFTVPLVAMARITEVDSMNSSERSNFLLSWIAPWQRRDAVGYITGDVPMFETAVSMETLSGPRLFHGAVAPDLVQPAEVSVGDDEDSDILPRRAKVRRLGAAASLSATRLKVVHQWFALVMCTPSRLLDTVLSEDLPEDRFESVRLALASRATGTLTNRLGHLIRLRNWMTERSLGWPPEEASVFAYLRATCTASCRSKASALMSSLSFLRFVIGWQDRQQLDASLVSSLRLVGFAAEQTLLMGVRIQAQIVLVAVATSIELKVIHGHYDRLLSLVAYTFLQQLAFRLRFSDLANVVSFEEAELTWCLTPTHTKTCRDSRLPLHLLGPKLLFSGLNWFQAYMDWRESERIPLGAYPSIPAMADGKWTKHSANLGDYNILLSELFQGEDRKLSSVSSHSGKATALSWCDLRGLSPPDRAVLGYHTVKGSKSIDAYSRHRQARPVQLFADMLRDVREGSWNPEILIKPKSSLEPTEAELDFSASGPETPSKSLPDTVSLELGSPGTLDQALEAAVAQANLSNLRTSLDLESEGSESGSDGNLFQDVDSDLESDHEAISSLEVLGRLTARRQHDGIFAINSVTMVIHAQWLNHSDLFLCSRHSTIIHRIVEKSDLPEGATLCPDCFPDQTLELPMEAFIS